MNKHHFCLRVGSWRERGHHRHGSQAYTRSEANCGRPSDDDQAVGRQWAVSGWLAGSPGDAEQDARSSGSVADAAACTRRARNAQTRGDRSSQAHSGTIQSSEAWHSGIAGGRGGEGEGGGAPQSAEQDPAQRRLGEKVCRGSRPEPRLPMDASIQSRRAASKSRPEPWRAALRGTGGWRELAIPRPRREPCSLSPPHDGSEGSASTWSAASSGGACAEGAWSSSSSTSTGTWPATSCTGSTCAPWLGTLSDQAERRKSRERRSGRCILSFSGYCPCYPTFYRREKGQIAGSNSCDVDLFQAPTLQPYPVDP
eukprot:COSAG06_NODE_1450_length_9437_cov_5.045299_3_plen_312_part_00